MEYNQEILNDDFITIWSNYLISNRYSDIETDIQCLAEMGNYKAIEKWYDLNNSENEHKIDSYFIKPNESVSYLMAYAAKLYNNELVQISTDARELENAYKERAINCFSNYFVWDNKVKSLEYKLKNYPYLLNLTKAQKLAKEKTLNSHDGDYNAYQEYIDVLYKIAETTVFSSEEEYYRNSANKFNNKLLKLLLKQYKQLLKSNEKLDRPFMFSLSKTLLNKGGKKCNSLAYKLLQELASKPLSNELTNYKDKHINNIYSEEKNL